MASSTRTTSKPILAIDLDEVLGQFVESICVWHNRRFHTSLTSEDFISYHFSAVPGWGNDAATASKVREFLLGPSGDTNAAGPAIEFLEVQPVEGAKEALTKLSTLFELVVVTARSEEIGVVTRDWLTLHYPGLFSRVILCNSYAADGTHARRSKGDVCKEIGAVALVDDNVGYCHDAARTVPFAFLFGSYAWNTRKNGFWEHAQPTPTSLDTKNLGAGAAPILPSHSTDIMAHEHSHLAPNIIRAGNWKHAAFLLRRLAHALSHGDGSNDSHHVASLRPIIGDAVLDLHDHNHIATHVSTTSYALVTQMKLRVRAKNVDIFSQVCEELEKAGASIIRHHDLLTADITRSTELLESTISASEIEKPW